MILTKGGWIAFLKRRLLTSETLPGSLWNNLTGRNNASAVGLTPVKIKSTRIEISFISQRPSYSETTLEIMRTETQ